MRRIKMRILLILLASSCGVSHAVNRAAEAKVRDLLDTYHARAQVLYNIHTRKAWAYSTNITDHNSKEAADAQLEVTRYQTQMYEEAQKYRGAQLSPEISRLLRMAFAAQLEEEDAKALTQISSNMSSIYGRGTVCLGPQEGEQCENLEPGLTRVLATSRNYTELSYVWESWRTRVSRKIRPFYLQYMSLINKGARLNNYTDAGDQMRKKYETDTFEQDMLALYEELDPLYRLVHAYVRKKLRQVYGDQVIPPRGPLPACVLGDMWGRFWTNLYPELVPYPEQPDIDVTQAMQEGGYNVTHMFKLGEEFFTSMGLKPLPATFWNLSMLERPEGRSVQCHATAWDFYDSKDFRIRMCSEVNFENLETIHHELGHIQYFMQYAHLPLTYRDGANDGFHEAIGELMSMSMSTPKHLAEIGLLKEVPESKELSINFLMRTALKSITTLPFHLVNDLWRWRLFRGEYDLDEANEEFWRLKEQYLGVVAPVPRTKDDLDPVSIFHIATGYDMIRYFTRTVLQFQFFETLCRAANHQGPLHTCDFYGSKEAGDLLAKMLSLGASQPWQDVLQVMTGERRMTARPLLDYFRPLKEWLEEDNARDGDGVGWGDSWRHASGLSGATRAATPLSLWAALLLPLLWRP